MVGKNEGKREGKTGRGEKGSQGATEHGRQL